MSNNRRTMGRSIDPTRELKRRWNRNRKVAWKQVVLITEFLIVCLMMTLPFVLVGLLSDFLSSSNGLPKIITVGVCVILALALPALRQRQRILFGWAKAYLGLLTVFSAIISPANGGLAYGLALAGGIYLMVEGKGDIHDGELAERRRRVRARLRRQLHSIDE